MADGRRDLFAALFAAAFVPSPYGYNNRIVLRRISRGNQYVSKQTAILGMAAWRTAMPVPYLTFIVLTAWLAW